MQGLRKVEHVQVKYLLAKKVVEQRAVTALYYPCSENGASSLTKALTGHTSCNHRKFHGVVSSYNCSTSCRGV